MNVMIEKIKEVHTEDICLFKSGEFYHAYGRDAYILSYVFGYKLRNFNTSKMDCGFPLATLNKVKAKLETKKINFLVIDNRNNFMVDEKSNNGNLNRYIEVYEKARNFINYRNRIDNINQFLMENIEKKDFRKLLGKIEQVVDEKREIFSN